MELAEEWQQAVFHVNSTGLLGRQTASLLCGRGGEAGPVLGRWGTQGLGESWSWACVHPLHGEHPNTGTSSTCRCGPGSQISSWLVRPGAPSRPCPVPALLPSAPLPLSPSDLLRLQLQLIRFYLQNVCGLICDTPCPKGAPIAFSLDEPHSLHIFTPNSESPCHCQSPDVILRPGGPATVGRGSLPRIPLVVGGGGGGVLGPDHRGGVTGTWLVLFKHLLATDPPLR